MKQVKRMLSIFLSAAMVITGINLGTLLPVQAEEMKDPNYIMEVTGEFKGSATDGDITIKTASDSRDGSKNQAPYISGQTSNGSIGNCGNDRYGCLVFPLPEGLKMISGATVTFSVTGANNVDNGGSWVKAALYQTENKNVTATDESTYRAINEDYSYEAAMWSDKKVTNQNNNVNEAAGVIKSGELNFDVKKALEAAVAQNSERLVLRVQAAKGGLKLNHDAPVKLTIDTSIPTTVTVKYVDAAGKELQNSKNVNVSVDSKYIYEVVDEEKKLTSSESKYYVYDEEHSVTTIEKVKEVVSGDDSTQNIITLKYNEITVEEQSGALELEMCAGTARLPDTVEAVFSDDSVAKAAVEWDREFLDASKYQTIGETVAVTGKFKGTSVVVNASVKVVKNLEQLNEDLTAWYPLDADAKDASGNGNDGTAAESVTFSRENGATFNGGEALANMITLPQTLNVTSNMTFAFWVKDDQGSKSNAFGIGSNEDVKEADGSKAHLFYVNTHDADRILASMNPKSWSGGTMVQIETPSKPKSEWHHITCVLEGKMLTLYVNGEKIETKDVAYTVKEMWDYEPDTRWAYIGNCIYGKNGDKDFKGSIKDFRIYNEALVEAQVTQAYSYKDEVLPIKYVKDDIISGMTGVKADYDGNLVITNVTTKDTDGKITLPTKSYNNATVAWEVTHDAITNLTPAENIMTGNVTIPAIGAAAAEGKLKATITLGQKQEVIEFNCSVFSVSEDITATDIAGMETLLNSVKNLREDNYTAKSWTAFKTAFEAAKQQVRQPLVKADFDGAKSNLETAKTGLVNIAALKIRIASLESDLVELGEEKELYTKASRDALEQKINAAKEKIAAESEATQDDIDTTLEGLPVKAVTELVRRGDKTALNDLVVEADAVKANKADYKADNWEAFEAALTTAKGQQEADLSQPEVNEAVKALKAAMEKLAPIDTQKVDQVVLADKIKNAKAESQSLVRTHYTQDTWTAYQDAIKELQAIADKPYATMKDVEKAEKALAAAYAGLRPTETHTPTEEAKTGLTTAAGRAEEEAKGMVQGNYTKESWTKYQEALAAMTKLAANIESATTEKITKVTNDYVAAKAALVDKSQLDKAIKDYAGLKASDYTAATWNAFKTALDTAKQISAKENATKDEVDSVLAALNAKKGALKKADTAVKVSKIQLSADYTKVAVGKKATLKAKVTPSNATNKGVTWSIDKTAKSKKYASISKGVLTTNKKGAGKTVTVTATAKDGSGTKKTIKIKIMKGGVKKVSLKAKTKKVKVGKKLSVKATVSVTSKKKSDANTKLTWKTSNKKVATVDSKGRVTGKKAGKVTITATSTDGTKKSGKIKLTVVKK